MVSLSCSLSHWFSSRNARFSSRRLSEVLSLSDVNGCSSNSPVSIFRRAVIDDLHISKLVLLEAELWASSFFSTSSPLVCSVCKSLTTKGADPWGVTLPTWLCVVLTDAVCGRGSSFPPVCGGVYRPVTTKGADPWGVTLPTWLCVVKAVCCPSSRPPICWGGL